MPFAVLRLNVFADLDQRAGRKTRDSGDALQAENRLHAPPRLVARVRLSGPLVPKTFRGDVHCGPQSVVVGRDRLVGREIPGNPEVGSCGEAPSIVTRSNAID